jgi:hypothetical protein
LRERGACMYNGACKHENDEPRFGRDHTFRL